MLRHWSYRLWSPWYCRCTSRPSHHIDSNRCACQLESHASRMRRMLLICNHRGRKSLWMGLWIESTGKQNKCITSISLHFITIWFLLQNSSVLALTKTNWNQHNWLAFKWRIETFWPCHPADSTHCSLPLTKQPNDCFAIQVWLYTFREFRFFFLEKICTNFVLTFKSMHIIRIESSMLGYFFSLIQNKSTKNSEQFGRIVKFECTYLMLNVNRNEM